MCAGAVLSIEKPVVRPERTVQPEGMIEAGELDLRIEKYFSVCDERRVEQREVEA